MPDADSALRSIAGRERAFLIAAGALLIAVLWAWRGGNSAPAEAIRREVTPAWWVAIAAVLGLTLALGRC